MSNQESLITKIKDCLSRGEDLTIPLLDVKSREVIEYSIRDLVLMYNTKGVFCVAPKHKNTRIYEIKFTSEASIVRTWSSVLSIGLAISPITFTMMRSSDNFIGVVDYDEGQIFARDPVKNYNRDHVVCINKRQLIELVWTGTDLVEAAY